MYKYDLHPTILYPALDFYIPNNNLPTAYASPGSLVIPVPSFLPLLPFTFGKFSLVYILYFEFHLGSTDLKRWLICDIYSGFIF